MVVREAEIALKWRLSIIYSDARYQPPGAPGFKQRPWHKCDCVRPTKVMILVGRSYARWHGMACEGAAVPAADWLQKSQHTFNQNEARPLENSAARVESTKNAQYHIRCLTWVGVA